MHIGLFVKDFAVGNKFSKDGLPTKSGAEFHAENHAKQLIKRGNEVTIFAKKRYRFTKARENIDGIDLVRLHAPFRWLEIIVRLLTTHSKIDAFYIIGTPKFAIWAILMAKLFRKPVTLALTAKMEIFDSKKGWRNRIFAKCNNYIATSKEIGKGYIECGGIDASKVTVLPHGLDTSNYAMPSKDDKKKKRKVLGIPTDIPVVVFCARIVEDKGIDVLLKAWPLVHDVFPEARLYVAGGGKKHLMDAMNNMGVSNDNSAVILGEVEHPQKYYQVGDIYLFPSRHEALPTSLIEAMSSGLTPLTCRIGGCEDVVKDGETGFMLPIDDYKAFADRMIWLITHKDECSRMAKNASRLIYDYCDYSNVIWKLEKIIHARTIL